jgi:hypothetical protein
MNIWEIENNFYLKSDVTRLKKSVCQFEVFKKSLNAKGAIVECGVFKGASLIRFLTYRDMFKKTKKKKIYGFDPFGRFPKQKIKEDQKFASQHDKGTGLGISEKKLKTYLKKKKFKNFSLIKGDLLKTLSVFLNKNKKFKISFLHLDMDVYEPTKFALESLYKKVTKNGIILIDDFYGVKGATRATKEFIKKNNLKIEKLSYDKRLSFIIKK